MLYARRHGIYIVMFANLLEAHAGVGAAEYHRNVTETTRISLQRLLFPFHPVTSTSPWYPNCYVC